MRFLQQFAHNTGTPHAETVVPWWQDELSVSVVLMLGFLSMLFVVHYVFKAKFGLKVVLAMAYMLVVGVLCYTVAPLLSIVSLGAGLAIALITTLLQLAGKSPTSRR